MSIIELIKKREYKKAEAIAIEQFEKNRSSIALSNTLGFVYLVRQKIYKAIETYLHSLSLNENDFEANNNLADLYLKNEEVKKAKIFASKAKEINKNSPTPLIVMTQVCMKEKNYAGAREFIEEAIQLFPNGIENNSYLKLLYCDVLLANKVKEKCLQFIKNCQNKKLDLNLSLYHSNINSEALSKTEIENAIEIRKKIDLSKIGNRTLKKEEISAFYLLGNVYEKTDQKLSEEIFFEANQLASTIQEFKPLTSQKYTERIIKLFSKDYNNYICNSDNSGDGYVFIVGMPRSGTTLTESIISTFDSVFPGGEMHSMSSLCRETYIADNYQLTENVFANINKNYSLRADYLKNRNNIFTDKLPHNYFHLGYIKCAFPNAKVIQVKRNRWDIATSIFKQFFVDNIRYSTKFFNIALQIANYEALMSFWNKNIDSYSDFVCQIDYEDLVTDTLKTSKKIASFLELDDNIDLSKRSSYFSETASKTQVSQGIYKKSLNKKSFHEHYGQFEDNYLSQIDYWSEKYGLF